MAKLYFRYGPMNSGKTRLLLAHNYEEIVNRVLIVKPEIDAKAGMNLQSKAGAEKTVDVLLSSEENVYEILKNPESLIRKFFILVRVKVDVLEILSSIIIL